MSEETEVLIEGLELPLFIGVLDFEHEARQRVVIDIGMALRAAPPPPGAEADYVSYAPIVEHLTALSESTRHIDLVEQLADEIFAFLFRDKRVAKATVRVMKPDIFAQARGVGVRITRSNPA